MSERSVWLRKLRNAPTDEEARLIEEAILSAFWKDQERITELEAEVERLRQMLGKHNVCPECEGVVSSKPDIRQCLLCGWAPEVETRGDGDEK